MTKRYKLIETNNHLIVEIADGKYKGTKYKYGVVSLDEDSLQIKFSYEVVNNKEFENEKEFESEISSILADIIENEA